MAGRPPLYETVEQLQEMIDNYFIEEAPITITGLALYLGFSDRQSLYDYEKRAEFSCIIKRARLRVENAYEIKLHSIMGSPTGAIFALKNMGWKDKVETGFTDGDGKDVSPITVFKLPHNGRNEDNNTATGLSGEGA